MSDTQKSKLDSGLIFISSGVELMESQVQSSSDAGEKDVFVRVCVCLLTMEMEVRPFMCVSVCVHVVKQGARQHLCFWAWGRPKAQGVSWLQCGLHCGKEPSASKVAALSHASLCEQLGLSSLHLLSASTSLSLSFFVFPF